MNRLNSLRIMTWTRILLFIREPEAVFWVFLFPVILALVLSFAFNQRGVESVEVGVVEGETAAAWIATLESGESLEIVRFPDREAAERKLRSGGVAALVTGEGGVTIRVDRSRPEGETARLRIIDVLERGTGRPDGVRVETDLVTEHGSRYIDFLIPGLLGMNLMATGIFGAGFYVVDLRQKKLLKRLLVTPMPRGDFLLAQMFSRFFFLVVEVALITLFGALVLGVPFRGNVLLFSFLCVLGAFCFSGLGLLLASRAQTLEGVSGLMNCAMLPMWLCSGVFFSYEKYPDVLHPMIRLLPLTALNDGLRALMLEGEGAVHLLPEVTVQIVWTALSFLLALRLFRWQ